MSSRGPDYQSGRSDESDDLRAIRRDTQMQRFSEKIWRDAFLDEGKFQREFDQVAIAAQDWANATYGERIRALRILMSRFGHRNTYLLTHLGAPKSMQEWSLKIRKRLASEMSDGGKRDRTFKREELAQRIGEEVYRRIANGESKADAIEAVKEDYRLGAPYPKCENFPVLHRPKLNLPDADGIEKLLAIFRRNARRRGYVEPLAPMIGIASEPRLKVSDIPKRGRPTRK